MTQPQAKRQYKLSGHSIYGKRKDSKIIPIYSGVKCEDRHKYEYISTCYKYDKSLTLYAIPFDLDLDKCSPRYIKNNKIDSELILNRLRTKYPGFLDVPITMVRTKSGGISLLINIVPIPYTDENGQPAEKTKGCIWSFWDIQRNILDLLCREGMGADPAATGLYRMVANYHVKPWVLYDNDKKLLKKISSERINLIQILRDITKNLNKNSRIYNHTTVGEKLHNYFMDFYEETLEGRDLFTINKTMLMDAGIDHRTARKILARDLEDLPWLKVVKRQKGEYLCKLAGDLYDWEVFAYDARTYGQTKVRRVKTSNYKTLKQPEEVVDGERNLFLYSAAILLAHEIPDSDVVTEIMERVAARIPGNEWSRNCRPGALRSIASWAVRTSEKYRHVERNQPQWLLEIQTHREGPQGLFGSPDFELEDFESSKSTADSAPQSVAYSKIGSHYGVFTVEDNGYTLNLLGFAKKRQYVPAFINDLKRQGYKIDDNVEELKENLSYLKWFSAYENVKTVLCHLTKYVILHDTIRWCRYLE